VKVNLLEKGVEKRMSVKSTSFTQNKIKINTVFDKQEKNSTIKLTPKKKNERENIPRKYLRARWKHFLSQDKEGDLLIEGVNIKEIVKKYGSPVYVIVEEEIRKKCKAFIEGFDYTPFRPQYACKCNSNLEVLRIIREEGFDFDASSVGEIILGLLADFKPEQITFTNLYKTKKDILFALEVGVAVITIDSIEELKTAISAGEQINKMVPIMLRINPMIKDGRFSTKKQQYGIPHPLAKKAINLIRDNPIIRLKGFHFHGSYAHNPKGYFLAAKKIVKLANYAKENGMLIEMLDFGGGFPVEAPKVYCPRKYFTPKEFGEKFVLFFKKLCKEYELGEVTLVFEPGKSIVANAGIGIIKVVSNKKLDSKEIVITDGSCYSMFPDVLISHCDYEILPGTKMRTKSTHKYDITGCTCDCIDVIATCQKMPKLEKGDLLVVMDTGAYSFVMGSNFNNLKLAPIIKINKDGETQLIRRRDRYSEIFGPELDVLKLADPAEMKGFYDLLRKNY
jgi:diaminopimelate decarboxylase